jgi:hypothetical protein
MHTMQNTMQSASTTLGQRTRWLREEVGQIENGQERTPEEMADLRAEQDYLSILSLVREDKLGTLEAEWTAAHYPTISGPLESGQSGRAWMPGQRVAPVVNVPTRTDRALAARIADNAVALERVADRILALAGDDAAPSMMEMAREHVAGSVSRGLKAKAGAEPEHVAPIVVTDRDRAEFGPDADWSEIDAAIAAA